MRSTVIEALEATVDDRGSEPALKYPDNGSWGTYSYNEYHQAVMRAARGFMALGLEPGQAVSIVGFNCPQWVIADLAAIAAGGMPAGIYTTSSPELSAYVAGHCEARIVVAENAEQLAKFKKMRDQLPLLKAFVLMYGEDADDDVYSWQDLLALGDGVDEKDLRARIDNQKPDDCASLIYTSGTTGRPKAVMLSHRNLLWTANSVRDVAGLQGGDCAISYLPLSHVAEQMFSIYGPITYGLTLWFAENLETMGDTLTTVRPHFFFGVPRVWEKIQSRMMSAGAQATPMQRRIAAWARNIGLKAALAEEQGTSRPLLYPLAKKLVFDKVKARLGLDRARFLGSGAAPIARETLDFFASLDMMIYEVWGQSESTGAGTLNAPGKVKRGSIGRVYPETDLKIAEDGEILMRGPSVFIGYLHNEEATQETRDADGWLYTGDIGTIDADGFVRITDRKKEIIITAGGENISPAHVEGEIKAISAISQCCVIGDKRRFLTALLTLDEEALPQATKAAGSPAKTVAETVQCPHFQKWLEQQMQAVNGRLARVQTVKKWTLLPQDFSIEGGELTPTMKLKRRIVKDKYSAEIEAMYAG